MEDLKLHDFDEYLENEPLITAPVGNAIVNPTVVLADNQPENNATVHIDTTEKQTTFEQAVQEVNDVLAEQQNNPNWDYYNQMQNIRPKGVSGRTNVTQSTEKQFIKRRKKNKMQRNSRRINRNNKK